MKLFSNVWFLAIVALVINLTITSALLLRHMSSMVQAPGVEKVQLPPEPNYEYWNFHSGEIEALVQELRDEHRRVEDRVAEIRSLESRLRAEREEIVRLRDEVEEARTRLSRSIVQLSEAEESNLATLAKTYAQLSPKATIAVFDELDDEFVVKLLSLMKPDLVATLFEQMTNARGGGSQADRVARLSHLLRLLQAEETNDQTV